MSKQEELPPRVLHISTATSWRGGEQQLFYLMEELEKKGITQYLICNEKGQLLKKAREEGWNVIPCKKRSGLDLNFARQIKHSCKTLEISVIHTHDSQAHTLAFLASVFFRSKTAIVVSRRVDFKAGKSAFSNWKYNHPSIKKIICVSKAIENVMKPSIKRKSLLCTIHSGIDFSRFDGLQKGNYLRTRYQIPEGQLLIGNVSAIAPHKDYYTFVNAIGLLVSLGVNAKFFIIGDGPERVAIEAYVKQKNLTENIIFTGFIENILPVLKELDIFLITSKTEGLGTTILDAFACEVPVVATVAGGIPEIIEHEKTGLSAEVGNADQLAKQVQKIIVDSDLRTQIITGANKKLQHFSRAHTAEKTLQVYHNIKSL